MRLRRRFALIAALLALVAAPIAQAASIPRLTGPVTDDAGVLGGRAGDVETALKDLLGDP